MLRMSHLLGYQLYILLTCIRIHWFSTAFSLSLKPPLLSAVAPSVPPYMVRRDSACKRGTLLAKMRVVFVRRFILSILGMKNDEEDCLEIFWDRGRPFVILFPNPSSSCKQHATFNFLGFRCQRKHLRLFLTRIILLPSLHYDSCEISCL